MISRLDLDERVREWQLRDAVVEKDYVIGWLLWGIGATPRLSQRWAFKGGTCLKKCYIETFRFSEDLDFTVLPDGPFSPEEVVPLLREMLQRVHEESGIDFSRQELRYDVRSNGTSAQGRIYYVGPRRAPSIARVKLDITLDEEVVRPTMLREIGHTYPDTLPDPATVRCYAFEEVFAEKLRALGERGRPRDLYDVILLYRRPDLRGYPELILETLQQKCETKGVPLPVLDAVRRREVRAELESEWENMLGHQLPELPPFEHAFDELPNLFDWLTGESRPERDLDPIAVGAGEDAEWEPPPLSATWSTGVPLEVVRFAAANHLCVELGYKGKNRYIEPYSLRRSRAGDLLLYGVKLPVEQIRCYRVDRIQSVRATRQPFKPRHPIEFTPQGRLQAPPTRRKGGARRSGARWTVQCWQCGRRFRRKRRNARIRPHKTRSGHPCSGRRGSFV